MIDLYRPGGLFTVGLYGSFDLTDKDKELLETIKPSGVILFQRNIINPKQVHGLINQITEFLGYKPLISIDQEGGIVSRLTDGYSVSPGAMAISVTKDTNNSYLAGKVLGKEMKAIGIDWDLAPVVDINNNPDNPGIGIRSFGDTREVVTSYAKEFVRGLHDEGIISCLKHFPGKGRVVADAHLVMPELDIDKKLLLHDELYPYLEIDSPSWMPSHVYYPALQSVKEPASVSKEVLTDLVRDELKYNGVLISDDMTMGGITKYYTVSEGVIKSFYAGMDNLLICHDFDKQIESYKAIKHEVDNNEIAFKRMEESLARIKKLFAISKKEKPSMECINSLEHTEVMKEITKKSIQILKNEENSIPLDRVDLIISVELTRKVQVEDTKDSVPLAVTLLAQETKAPVRYIDKDLLSNPSKIIEEVKGKKIVIFTENAHLDDSMKLLLLLISEHSEVMTVCALRNPYDMDIVGVKNIICSYGYTTYQQEELVMALLGKIPQV